MYVMAQHIMKIGKLFLLLAFLMNVGYSQVAMEEFVANGKAMTVGDSFLMKDIHWSWGSADLCVEGAEGLRCLEGNSDESLKSLSTLLASNSGVSVEIIYHAYAVRGGKTYREQRSNSVKSYLVNQGLDEGRITSSFELTYLELDAYQAMDRKKLLEEEYLIVRVIK